MKLKSMSTPKYTNIHDYLEMIGAEPPEVSEQVLQDAYENMIICFSIEEAVEALDKLDEGEARK
jgi:hypothetical protein